VVIGSAWAEALERGQAALLRHDFRQMQIRVGLVSAAIACIAISCTWAGRSLFHLVGLANPRTVAMTFTLVAIGIPFALASQVAVRLLIAARETALFPLLALGTFVVNLALDLILVRQFGVA